jgi:hypothetical protein
VDHRLDARSCLFVLGQQLRAFADQLIVRASQHAILFRQVAAKVSQLFDLGFEVVQ